MAGPYEMFLEGRETRRTLADAIAVFDILPDFNERSLCEIRVLPLWTRSGKWDVRVEVHFYDLAMVSLPIATGFRARDSSGRKREYKPDRFDRAIIDGAAKVRLTDGTYLDAVEIIRSRLPWEPSPLQWGIVHHVIEMTREQHRCYRSLRDGIPKPFDGTVPNRRFIDCHQLIGLDIPPLKVIKASIDDYYPDRQITE